MSNPIDESQEMRDRFKKLANQALGLPGVPRRAFPPPPDERFAVEVLRALKKIGKLPVPQIHPAKDKEEKT